MGSSEIIQHDFIMSTAAPCGQKYNVLKCFVLKVGAYLF